MLSLGEPPPFDVHNVNGRAPILITCDHAANRIPASLSNLGMEASMLERHIAYDIGARQVAMALSKRFDAPMLLSTYSRLVIDLNRHLDDPTLIVDVSDSTTIFGNRNLSATQKRERINTIFRPYHDMHGRLVDQLVARHATPFILSVHSFTPTFNGSTRPWHFGVLWDRCESLAKKLVRGLRQDNTLCVGENQPYHATDPLGYSMVVHAQNRGIDMGLIEIRQDLIEHPAGQQAAAETLARTIASL